MIIDSGVVTGSLIVSGSSTVTGNSNFQGNVQITGSLNVNGSISGAITGSITNAVSASYAVSASHARYSEDANFAQQAVEAVTASQARSASYAVSASHAGTATTSSRAISAALADTAETAANATFATTASRAVSAANADNATLFNSLSSSQFPQLVQNNTFTGNNIFGNITGSNAQFNSASIVYLSVIYQTSSIVYSSGSNQLGDASNDTQTLWGRVDLPSGPLTVTGSINVSAGITGSLNGSNLIAASVANDRLTNSAITIAGNSTSLGGSITAATILSGTGVFSGSAQVTGLTNANLSGTAGISNANLANSAVTFNGSAVSLGGSATITANTTNTLTIGTGLSGTSFNGSSAVTIANAGVTSISAGTGVTRDVSTGAVTISIGQAVATNSNVQFNSLGVGTAGSATAGEIRATNDITAFYSSDERLKENITPIENPIEKLMAINGVTFDWKEGFDEVHSHKGADTGVIAQQIEAIGLPETVTTRENGFKAVKYEKLNALLIEGFKAQQKEINELKELVNTLLNK